MGLHFGELATIRGIVSYKLSPFEQNPFAGAITHGAPNLVKRFTATALYWVPPFIAGWLTYVTGEEKHRLSLRKNPRDYIDEVDPNAPVDEE